MADLQEPPAKKAKTNCTVHSNREAQKTIVEMLSKRLDDHDQNRVKIQEELSAAFSELHKQLEEANERISSELQKLYTEEDNRLQEMLNRVREFEVTEENNEKFTKVLQEIRADLALMQLYELEQEVPYDLSSVFTLNAEKKAVNEFIDLEKPENFRVTENAFKRVHFDFTRNTAFENALCKSNSGDALYYEILLKKKGKEDDSKLIRLEEDGSNSFILKSDSLKAEETYVVKVRAAFSYKEFCREGEWSDEIEFTMPEFAKCFAWREHRKWMTKSTKYSLNSSNPRIAESCCMGDCYSVVAGNSFLPQGKVTSWSIKLLNMTKHGEGILVGVMPFEDDINDLLTGRQGLYFDCYNSTLRKGLWEAFKFEGFSNSHDNLGHMHTGDTIGVIADTTKGELSFVFNGINFGVAFEEIPLDRPLLPCVVLPNSGDSVELDTSEVDVRGDSSVPVPLNIEPSSPTFDSITLRWSAVEGASFYQIETDGIKLWDASKTNEFTIKNIPENSEHTFRVRTVKGRSVSEWSDVVKWKPVKKAFADCMWKECPADAYTARKYMTSKENPRIVKKVGSSKSCIVIGNIFIPPNRVVPWNIKILGSSNNTGFGIFIGVAPSDINLNENEVTRKCGWYFGCYSSSLWSGFPHKYEMKLYGPRKEDGKYVHTGDSVGVVMDTTKGELSFALNGVNLGVAYAGVPLDKPLVPCVVLEIKNDSVELLI